MRGLRTAALALSWAAAAAAQEPAPEAGAAIPLRVSSAVAPETVTVGDRFRSVLQVVVPPGATVEFPPLPVGDTLQPVDSVRVIPGRAGEPPIASYALVAWVAGVPLQAQVPVRVELPGGGGATYLVRLRLPVVRSVLPADTAGLRPKPARGVLALPAAPRPWWPWLLLGLAVLALAVAAWRLLRRAPHAAEPGTPRERALAALDRIAAARATGDPVRLYPEVTRVLRRYLAEIRPAWGVDLTSSELLSRMAAETDSAARERLAALLQHADRVKFARHAPDPAEVERFLAGSRAWVESHPAAAAPRPGAREEAA